MPLLCHECPLCAEEAVAERCPNCSEPYLTEDDVDLLAPTHVDCEQARMAA